MSKIMIFRYDLNENNYNQSGILNDDWIHSNIFLTPPVGQSKGEILQLCKDSETIFYWSDNNFINLTKDPCALNSKIIVGRDHWILKYKRILLYNLCNLKDMYLKGEDLEFDATLLTLLRRCKQNHSWDKTINSQ